MNERKTTRRVLPPAPVRWTAFAFSGLIVAWMLHELVGHKAPEPPSYALQRPSDETPPRDNARLIGIPPAGASLSPGEPVGSSPSASVATNESLHAYLKTQEKTMGIRRILPPGARETADASNAESMIHQMETQLGRAIDIRRPPSVRLNGSKPEILSKHESASGASGAPILESSAVSAPPRTTLRLEGAVVRNAQELRSLWSRIKTTESLPTVDFPRQMLIAVYSMNGATGVDIVSIQSKGDRLVVRYRLPPPHRAAASYQLRVLDRSDLPVLFQNDASASTGIRGTTPPPPQAREDR